MEEQYIAVDMLKLIIGVEHYYETDEKGTTGEYKSIQLYSKEYEMKSDKASRLFLINLETGDEIQIDQDGNCRGLISCDRDVLDIQDMHTFQETVDQLISTTSGVVDLLPYGEENLQFFRVLSEHMNKAVMNGHPAYLEASIMDQVIDTIGNIYVLSYGNPLTKESKIRCLYDYTRNSNHPKK